MLVRFFLWGSWRRDSWIEWILTDVTLWNQNKMKESLLKWLWRSKPKQIDSNPSLSRSCDSWEGVCLLCEGVVGGKQTTTAGKRAAPDCVAPDLKSTKPSLHHHHLGVSTTERGERRKKEKKRPFRTNEISDRCVCGTKAWLQVHHLRSCSQILGGGFFLRHFRKQLNVLHLYRRLFTATWITNKVIKRKQKEISFFYKKSWSAEWLSESRLQRDDFPIPSIAVWYVWKMRWWL